MFLNDDFLLTTDTARELFHQTAKDLPIVDYHCHLDPQEIADDQPFSGIIEAWLGKDGAGDHYKWRLLRANGVDENLITGNGDDWAKFEAFAGTLERAVGNPVYLWTHLELQRYFGITEPLTRASARRIFEQTNEMIQTPQYSRRNLLRKLGVEIVCTTDDPADDLAAHQQLKDNDFQVLPAMRPDAALNVNKPAFVPWLERMEQVLGRDLNSFEDLTGAIDERIEFFHQIGSRLSDHGFDLLPFATASASDLDRIFAQAKAGKGADLDATEVAQYQTALMQALMRSYHQRDWTMQLHVHAARNLNTAGFKAHGADTGYDAIRDGALSRPLAQLLDSMTAENKIPRTIIYSLNATDYLPIATTMGSFQGEVRQKFQLGNAWWFNDTRTGIRQQLQVMAEQSLLGNFVGMTTDSRSFLSYPRHEFFRRILCELMGEWVARGEITSDMEHLSGLVKDICYTNARSYFSK
ncbi:glucuronate isomerase [Boudabousia tangfeifanii]|uniref:Uronate isomerase n=1 Tax=Boudabousia tangfeifanii TaxID=1912795 RepID=A0A1D9MIS5_9ACTO|nr:glucuronate isomerase [Boudabousia tangfeifanii]AOZ72093.1 glucuronate isomerase [Boudabousia tangfeifanii]